MKKDWNIFYVKTELENDGQLNPPLQHFIPSSQLSFLTCCCLLKITTIDYFVTYLHKLPCQSFEREKKKTLCKNSLFFHLVFYISNGLERYLSHS